MIAQMFFVICLIASGFIVNGQPGYERSNSVPPASCLPDDLSVPSPSGFTAKAVAKGVLQRTRSTVVRFARNFIGYGGNARVDSDNNCFEQYELSMTSWTNIPLKKREVEPTFPGWTGKPRLLVFLYPRSNVPHIQIRYFQKLGLTSPLKVYGTLSEAASTQGILRDDGGVDKKLYLIYNPSKYPLFVTAQDDDTMLMSFDIINKGIRLRDYDTPRAGGASLVTIFNKISGTLYRENFQKIPTDWARIHALPQYADLKGDYQPKEQRLINTARAFGDRAHEARLWLQRNVKVEIFDVARLLGFPPAFQPIIPFAYMEEGSLMKAKLFRQTSYEISKTSKGANGLNAASRSSIPPSMETTRIYSTDWQLVSEALKVHVEAGEQVHIIVCLIAPPVGMKVHVDQSNRRLEAVSAQDFIRDPYLNPQHDDDWCMAFPLGRNLVKRVPKVSTYHPDFLPIYYRLSVMEPGIGIDLQNVENAQFITPPSSPVHPRFEKQPTRNWIFKAQQKGCFTRATITDMTGGRRKCELTAPVDINIDYSFGTPIIPEVTVIGPPRAGVLELQSAATHATWFGVVPPETYGNYIYEKNKLIPNMIHVKQLGSSSSSRKPKQEEVTNQESERLSPKSEYGTPLNSLNSDRNAGAEVELDGPGRSPMVMGWPTTPTQGYANGAQDQVGQTGVAVSH